MKFTPLLDLTNQLLGVKRSLADDGLPSDCAQSHNVCTKHQAEPLEEEGECIKGQHNLLCKNGGNAAEVQNCLSGGMDAILLLIEPGLQVINRCSQTLEEEPGEPIAQSCKEETNTHRDKDDCQQKSCYNVSR